eukprot:gene3959-5678_t
MTTDITACLKKRLCCWIASNARAGITYSWLFSMLLVFIAFIVASISVARISKTSGNGGSLGKAAGFIALWTALLLAVISLMGTLIMRRYQSAVAVGFFLGVVFIIVQQMLILFAIFAERAQKPNQSLSEVQSQEAMAVFAFFLFIIYTSFGSMLAVFRNDIIKEEIMTDDPVDDFDKNLEESQQEQE